MHNAFEYFLSVAQRRRVLRHQEPERARHAGHRKFGEAFDLAVDADIGLFRRFDGDVAAFAQRADAVAEFGAQQFALLVFSHHRYELAPGDRIHHQHVQDAVVRARFGCRVEAAAAV